MSMPRDWSDQGEQARRRASEQASKVWAKSQESLGEVLRKLRFFLVT